MFEQPASCESLELCQASVECNRSWRLMGSVSGPSAELCDEPCGLGESSFAMRIFLKLGVALEVFIDRIEHLDFFGRERKACWKHIVAIAGLNELNDDGCSFGGNGYQLHQPIGGFKLAILDLQALGFHRAKELLDDPAPLVPGDDLPGVSDTGDLMGRQQEPMDGLCAFGWMQLDDLHEVERDAFGQILFPGVFRPLQNDASETQRKVGLARTAVDAFGHINHRLGAKRHTLDRLAQRSALDQRMVVHDPGKQVDISFGCARPMGIDVALPIIDHSDHAGLRQNVLGLGGRRQPTGRFLVRQGALCMRNFDVALAGPHLAAGKPKTGAAIRINRYHGVQEHAKNIAFPNLSEPAPVVLRGGKFNIAGVLDRQNVTISNRYPCLLAPAFNQPVNRHVRIGYETPIPHLLTPHTTCNPAQANTARVKHATEKRRPPLSRRRSPKRPKDKFSAVCISDPPAESILGQRTTPLIIRESCPHFPSQNAALKCVDALARLRGGEGWGKCPNAALEKATPPDLASPKIRP